MALGVGILIGMVALVIALFTGVEKNFGQPGGHGGGGGTHATGR